MKRYTHIILMGMKHSGKSTLGALLSQTINLPFYDTDTVITQLSGKTPRKLYESGGSHLMMEWETAACRYLVSSEQKNPSVIATGGGLADNEEALKVLKKKGLCIYIDTPCEILFERIQESAKIDGQFPPFLQGNDPQSLFLELFTRRSSIYAIMADVHIQAAGKSPAAITQEITDYINYEQRTNLHSRR